jgi:hypothetical protein
VRCSLPPFGRSIGVRSTSRRTRSSLASASSPVDRGWTGVAGIGGHAPLPPTAARAPSFASVGVAEVLVESLAGVLAGTTRVHAIGARSCREYRRCSSVPTTVASPRSVRGVSRTVRGLGKDSSSCFDTRPSHPMHSARHPDASLAASGRATVPSRCIARGVWTGDGPVPMHSSSRPDASLEASGASLVASECTACGVWTADRRVPMHPWSRLDGRRSRPDAHLVASRRLIVTSRRNLVAPRTADRRGGPRPSCDGAVACNEDRRACDARNPAERATLNGASS